MLAVQQASAKRRIIENNVILLLLLVTNRKQQVNDVISIDCKKNEDYMSVSPMTKC